MSYLNTSFLADVNLQRYKPKNTEKLLAAANKVIDEQCKAAKASGSFFAAAGAFTRDDRDGSKLPLETFVKILISDHDKTQTELMQSWFEDKGPRASSSAFTQVKKKVRYSFFWKLFYEINQILLSGDLFEERYRLIAIDGSNKPTAVNKDEPENIVHRKDEPQETIRAGQHMSLMLDIGSQVFLGCYIQSQKCKDERKAAMIMIEHYRRLYHDDGVIPVFIMDRGYFSYKLALMLEKLGYKYLIRTKTREFSSLFPELIENSGIKDAVKTLTWHQRYKEKTSADSKYLPKTLMRQIDEKAEFIKFPVRGVSFQLDSGEYEYLLTNLIDKRRTTEFYLDLYHLRWQIETAIGQLKYGAGLRISHSRKAEFVKQEIYAALICWNLTVTIARFAALKEEQAAVKRHRRHQYRINLTNAVRFMKKQLCSRWRLDREFNAEEIESEICREKSCVRPGRSFKRNLRAKRFIWYSWR